MFLHTSPEFACKKLLAAGETKIFDMARVYRNREQGPLHASEFTMLEWYRAGASWTQVMEDTVDVCREAVLAVDRKRLEWRGQSCDPYAEAERLTLSEAFARHAGLELEPLLKDRAAMAAAAQSVGTRVGAEDSWSDIFSRDPGAAYRAEAGAGAADVCCALTLLKRRRWRGRWRRIRGLRNGSSSMRAAWSWANGFGELTDAVEQRRRFEAEMEVKQAAYGERYPLDEEFLAALAHMPAASGVALGFDRLVMLATGARRISDVLWTPPVSMVTITLPLPLLLLLRQ